MSSLWLHAVEHLVWRRVCLLFQTCVDWSVGPAESCVSSSVGFSLGDGDSAGLQFRPRGHNASSQMKGLMGARSDDLVRVQEMVISLPDGDRITKGFSCNVCGKMFKNSKDCRRHTIIHTGSKPFNCPYCPHSSNLNFNLKKHVSLIHPDKFVLYLDSLQKSAA